MYAYKLHDTIGYEEDGEYGAHSHLLKPLHGKDNMLVSVIRWSGPHLGPQRFKDITEIATQAVTNLECETEDEEEGEAAEAAKVAAMWNDSETW